MRSAIAAALVLAACGSKQTPKAHHGAAGASDDAGADVPTPVEGDDKGGEGGDDAPAATTSALSADDQAILAAHNADRARHCAPPLAWSDKLAKVAQAWADHLRDEGCGFEHSQSDYGENLAAGSTGAMPPDAVVAMWYDEEKKFNFKRGGFSMDTGHFTQLVWIGTTQVGCGMSQCNGMDVWVCNYDPPGNVEGEYRDNVKPEGCH